MSESKDIEKLQAHVRTLGERLRASEECIALLRAAVQARAFTPDLQKRAETSLRLYDNHMKDL